MKQKSLLQVYVPHVYISMHIHDTTQDNAVSFQQYNLSKYYWMV